MRHDAKVIPDEEVGTSWTKDNRLSKSCLR